MMHITLKTLQKRDSMTRMSPVHFSSAGTITSVIPPIYPSIYKYDDKAAFLRLQKAYMLLCVTP